MDWKLKEKLQEHIVTVVLSLITSLCLIIWQAVPSEAWERLGAAIPKRALGALTALMLIALVTATAYIFSLRSTVKQNRVKLSAAEEKTPSLTARIAELASQHQEAEIKVNRLTRQVESLTHDVLDETGKKILNLIAQKVTYSESIARAMNLHDERVKFYLKELERLRYVDTEITTSGESYFLEQKARDFLLKNGMI